MVFVVCEVNDGKWGAEGSSHRETKSLLEGVGAELVD